MSDKEVLAVRSCCGLLINYVSYTWEVFWSPLLFECGPHAWDWGQAGLLQVKPFCLAGKHLVAILLPQPCPNQSSMEISQRLKGRGVSNKGAFLFPAVSHDTMTCPFLDPLFFACSQENGKKFSSAFLDEKLSQILFRNGRKFSARWPEAVTQQGKNVIGLDWPDVEVRGSSRWAGSEQTKYYTDSQCTLSKPC